MNGEEAGRLIDHIVTHYHAVHRAEMADLIQLASAVEAAHPAHPEAPRGLTDLLRRMAWEMEAHMQKEEHGLFPELRAGGERMAMAMAVMRDEHEDHAARLDQLSTLTRHHQAPADACVTWRRLYAGTAKFADDLREHIRLENGVLFPGFGA